MAVRKTEVKSTNSYIKEITRFGVTEEQAKLIDEFNKSFVNGTYISESCIVCGGSHVYYEHRADKQLIRNLDTLVSNGGKMPTKNQRISNNREHNDVNKKSLLVHFGLAIYQEMTDEEDRYIGTYYVITELGEKFAKGEAKIPLIITIRDGQVVDRFTKCVVSRSQVKEEFFKGAKFKNTAKKNNNKYIPLNLRVFSDNKYNEFIEDSE